MFRQSPRKSPVQIGLSCHHRPSGQNRHRCALIGTNQIGHIRWSTRTIQSGWQCPTPRGAPKIRVWQRRCRFQRSRSTRARFLATRRRGSFPDIQQKYRHCPNRSTHQAILTSSDWIDPIDRHRSNHASHHLWFALSYAFASRKQASRAYSAKTV